MVAVVTDLAGVSLALGGSRMWHPALNLARYIGRVKFLETIESAQDEESQQTRRYPVFKGFGGGDLEADLAALQENSEDVLRTLATHSSWTDLKAGET